MLFDALTRSAFPRRWRAPRARAGAALPGWITAWITPFALAAALWPEAARALDAGPGGPVLVITSGSANQAAYIPEILRAEGLNLFRTVDIANVSAATLAPYDLVILAKMPLSAARVADLVNWVGAGGNLIAFAPDAQLAPLLGLRAQGAQLAQAYLLADNSSSPGNGIVHTTLQYHGAADLYVTDGARTLATLYTDAVTPTPYPALSLRAVGAGQAAAFTYDLATSIVLTRQGNPAWAGQERDGYAPVRSDDKFYGNAAGDPQRDWVDPARIGIPQADEQQRLLANLMASMNSTHKPLPRFWYFPQGRKAVVVMTGDDHGNGGTSGRFDKYIAASTAGCNVDLWQCVRSTSYVYPDTPISLGDAGGYDALGFEISLHINTDCGDFSAASINQAYTDQLGSWAAHYTPLPAPVTERHHCIVWSDWAGAALAELAHGVRLDTTYYAWPPSWIDNVPGYMTGSALPMRFAALDGTPIDVYMAATQVTDESGQTFPMTIDTLLDNALGANGFYGAITVNAHTDTPYSDVSDAVVASAQARGVAVISARQLLKWLDGRNGSSFGAIAWHAGVLSFSVQPGAGSAGLQAMVPATWAGARLASLSRAGSPVATTVSTIKGVEYALFDAALGGSFVASYVADTVAPTVASQTPSPNASAVDPAGAVTLRFSEAMDAATIDTTTIQLRNAAGALVAASVSYDPATRTARLVAQARLAPGARYGVSVAGDAAAHPARDLAGNAVHALSWSFTTGTVSAGPNCPCSVWPANATPGVPSANDTAPVEVGVKFRADSDGFITGLRFYKGPTNTGVHIGNLWTAAGQHLAGATFTGETPTGWQTVMFAQPVPVAANTVYVASYLAPDGGYAADEGQFASAGIDTAPLHLPRDGLSGGNGVYAYGATSSFPADTYLSSNYWVDVIFDFTAPADTTPPAVTSTVPAAGTVGVNVGTPITAVFSEALDAATVTAASVELRDAQGQLVPAAVSYAPEGRVATLLPQRPLAPAATYAVRLHGGAAAPRLADLAGNALATDVGWSFTTATPSAACATPANPIVAQNCLAGTPDTQWDIEGAGDPSIEGFATRISVARGETVTFKVSTFATDYRLDLYRLGYYGGAGARKIATLKPSAVLPQPQPPCLRDDTTGLVDCGNWQPSASWSVPADATSGIYIAKLVRSDTGGASHIAFVVRDDASHSAMLVQTSDATWQAYNVYLGQSLYTGVPGVAPARAYKVSYNRPFKTRAVDGGQDWLFNAEYPMLRFLEANGYDLSYTAQADVDRAAALLRNHKIFLSVGHDEYWSGGQRANVTAARDAGVNLAFFSGNEVFWKTRWEPAIDGSGTPYRTLVCYKETHANAKIDPSPAWTGAWRDPRLSPPADGGKPENALTGTLFAVNDGATTAIVVPASQGRMRFWRHTDIASLAAGQSATLPDGTLGYEWDTLPDNGSQPAGLVVLSNTVVAKAPVLQDYGSTFETAPATHRMVLYKAASGARVFGAGTVQWAWGLDANHDRTPTPTDLRMQQASVNLFADMGVQPATLMAGLAPASASTDRLAPVSAITAPAAGATLEVGTPLTLTGTATDAGGLVGGVEVSTDDGATWHPAIGRTPWSYAWTPQATGHVQLRSRAVDDSANLEIPAAGIGASVGPDVTPPVLKTRAPAAGATNVSRGAAVNVTFSEPMAPTSISPDSLLLETASGARVAASVSYDAGTRIATLVPTAALTSASTYSATVVGGASGSTRVTDIAGNALAASTSWTFRTK